MLKSIIEATDRKFDIALRMETVGMLIQDAGIRLMLRNYRSGRWLYNQGTALGDAGRALFCALYGAEV